MKFGVPKRLFCSSLDPRTTKQQVRLQRIEHIAMLAVIRQGGKARICAFRPQPCTKYLSINHMQHRIFYKMIPLVADHRVIT